MIVIVLVSFDLEVIVKVEAAVECSVNITTSFVARLYYWHRPPASQYSYRCCWSHCGPFGGCLWTISCPSNRPQVIKGDSPGHLQRKVQLEYYLKVARCHHKLKLSPKPLLPQYDCQRILSSLWYKYFLRKHSSNSLRVLYMWRSFDLFRSH